MSYAGKAALITGASRGLGAALAERLAERGARLLLVARQAEALDPVVERIRERGGVAFAFSADLGNKDSIYPLAGSAAALIGPIDLLIHNASELGPSPLRLLLDTECEDLERVLAVNLIGPFRLSKAIAGSMALRGRGTILHISSDAAVEAYPRWGAYSVSKAALDHLSRLWASELAELGVTVLSVDPGEMDTDMHRAALPDADPSSLLAPDEVARRIVRILESSEVRTGTRLLASDWAASP